MKQEQFEGPLELLLELVEKEKLPISEISLGRVAEDYIRYVRSLEKIEPDALAEFLVVAAQLMLVKSRSLLPPLAFSEEEEQSIEELEKRLKEYKRIRELCRELRHVEGGGLRGVGREAFLGISPFFYPPPRAGAATLKDAFLSFLTALPKIAVLAEERLRYVVSLEEKITHIRNFLEGTLQKKFSEILHGAKEKVEVIVSFLALLELARQRFVTLEQEKPFDEITITKLPKSDIR